MKKMKISVTEASRNFAECVNRAHYNGVEFLLIKNGKPVARLTPEKEKVCTGRDFAAMLKQFRLPENEARAWRRERKAAHRALKVPANRWR